MLVGPAGPVVIDWAAARTGPAGVDVAMTALLLAEVAVGGLHAGAGDVADVPLDTDAVDALLTAFLQHADADPLAHLDAAVAFRTPHAEPPAPVTRVPVRVADPPERA